jgi:uncharacterized linocin/CFP29 family protein
MNNLHRELAPISAAAWEDIEDEAKRSFRRNVAGRRLVDVSGPHGLDLASVTTGHRHRVDLGLEGVRGSLRESQPLTELKVPFTISREAIDDVDRGAQDPDWDPVVDAARTIALAEDHAVFNGLEAARITGITPGATSLARTLPEDVRDYPDAVSQAMTALRLESIDGPYALALSADAYREVNETTNHGYPIIEHLRRVLDGPIVWAPAIEGGVLLSRRGGDFELTIGQDVSIGYDSHDAETVTLYFQESVTFLSFTPEAAIPLRAGE